MNPIVETRDLGKAFGATIALKGVNLEIPPHQVIGLVGPNGAGKTTLFSILSGFLKPGFGSVRVLGHSPSNYTMMVNYNASTTSGSDGYQGTGISTFIAEEISA